MKKHTILFLGALILLLAGPAFIKFQQIEAGMAMLASNTMPPSSVEVIEVRREQWQTRVAAVGSLTAREGIDVSNEVEGVIEAIHVESGQYVSRGDLLVSLNDDVEQADLASALAQEELAMANFRRIEQMWKKQTVSKHDFDDARSNLQVAQANVAQIRARIAKKDIRAPFDGVLGIRSVSTGQYLPPGTRLFSLQDHRTLFADFSVPEQFVPDIRPGLSVQFQVSAHAGQQFSGTVQAVDAKVDEGTRNINVRAQMDNASGLLSPGMYADINLILEKPVERYVVPSTAIVFSSFGDSVFIVEEDDSGQAVARQAQVVTGEQRGNQVEILQGLQGDETVVQAGTSKLRNNAPVSVSDQRRLKG